MIEFTFDDKGLRTALRRLSSQTRKAVAASLFQEGEIIMAVAKDRTPVRDGYLKESGHVQLPTISSDEISVVLGFGGPTAPYAVVVHEDLDAHHTVGQAKFLESALMEAEPDLADRLARRVQLNLRDIIGK